MQRQTHRRPYSHPTPRRQLRGYTGVRSAKGLRGQRRARPVRATAAAPGAALALPRVSMGTWQVARDKIAALAITLLLGTLVFSFFSLDLFYVFEPDVIGLENLNKQDVVQASGITGYNVFFIDGASVERTLSKVPEIKSVHVVPGLPNRLSIEIIERAPEVVWLRGGQRYWVDADGVLFRASGDKPELPTIRDLDQAPVKPGSQVAHKALDAYQALQSAMPDAPRQLEWSTARGLAFADERGWKIYLGDENGMTGKVVKLQALVQQLQAQNAQVKFIDLGRGDPYYQ